MDAVSLEDVIYFALNWSFVKKLSSPLPTATPTGPPTLNKIKIYTNLQLLDLYKINNRLTCTSRLSTSTFSVFFFTARSLKLGSRNS